MTCKLVAIEMFAPDKTLGKRLSVSTTFGMIDLACGAKPVAVPEEIAKRMVRDYSKSIRMSESDDAAAVVEQAGVIYRSQFLSRYGGSATKALDQAKAKLDVAQKELAEAERIAAEVKELQTQRQPEPDKKHRSFSQPFGGGK